MDHEMSGMDHEMSGMDHEMSGMGHEMSGMGHEMPGMDHDKSGMPPLHRLNYSELSALEKNRDSRTPSREILVRLTGNMERYIWTINGKKYSQAEPIRLVQGERVRLKFVNETMMNHPMHLHGMWMEMDNGKGVDNPRKSVINVAPGQTMYANVTVDAPVGKWAMHCHLLYHMASGMFTTVLVKAAEESR